MKKLKVKVEAEFTTCIGDSVDGVMETRSKISDDTIDMLKEDNRDIKITWEEIPFKPIKKRKFIKLADALEELSQSIISDEDEWEHFEEFLKDGGDPSDHILYVACVVGDNLEALAETMIENCDFIDDYHDFNEWLNSSEED